MAVLQSTIVSSSGGRAAVSFAVRGLGAAPGKRSDGDQIVDALAQELDQLDAGRLAQNTAAVRPGTEKAPRVRLKLEARTTRSAEAFWSGWSVSGTSWKSGRLKFR